MGRRGTWQRALEEKMTTRTTRDEGNKGGELRTERKEAREGLHDFFFQLHKRHVRLSMKKVELCTTP